MNVSVTSESPGRSEDSSDSQIHLTKARKRQSVESSLDDSSSTDTSDKETPVKRLRADTYRGRSEVGTIRKVRDLAGLNQQFKIEKGDILDPFGRHLTNLSKADASIKNTVPQISKMLHFVQRSSGLSLSGPSKYALLQSEKVWDYYTLLSKDLDQTGRGVGLQPSAFKNELASLLKFLNYVASISQDEMEFHSKIHSMINIAKEKIATNQRNICRAATQQHIIQAHSGITCQPHEISLSVSNDEVERKCKEVLQKYGPTKRRCTDEDDYTFLHGYLINALSLKCFQRGSAVQGMTTDEVKMALKAPLRLDGEVLYEVMVADHKTGAQQPAPFYLEESDAKLLKLYIKCFRPKTKDTNKVFLLRKSRNVVGNLSATMHKFQRKYSLRPLSSTDASKGAEELTGKYKGEQVTVDITAITAHSEATAQRHYRVTQFSDRARKAFLHLRTLTERSKNASTLPDAQQSEATASGEPDGSTPRPPSVASVSSMSSAASAEEDWMVALKKEVYKRHPPTPEKKAPIYRDIRNILELPEMENKGNMSWRNNAPRSVISMWREQQHQARAHLISTELDLTALQEEEVLELIELHHPACTISRKLQGIVRNILKRRPLKLFGNP